jgi:hypothetical protein
MLMMMMMMMSGILAWSLIIRFHSDVSIATAYLVCDIFFLNLHHLSIIFSNQSTGSHTLPETAKQKGAISQKRKSH